MRNQYDPADRLLDEMSPALQQAPPTQPMQPMWRDGRLLVVGDNVTLVDRCIKCGEPAVGHPLKRRMYWHHPALYLIILAGVLIYVIVALVLRQTITVHVGLCDQHRRGRSRKIALSWLTVLGGIALVIAGIANESGLLALLGVVAFFGGLVFAAIALPLLRPVKIENKFGRFKGCCEAFLARLPQAPRIP